jgi:hypothetical protein
MKKRSSKTRAPKKGIPKLRLYRETLCHLHDRHLEKAIGGAEGTVHGRTCDGAASMDFC